MTTHHRFWLAVALFASALIATRSGIAVSTNGPHTGGAGGYDVSVQVSEAGGGATWQWGNPHDAEHFRYMRSYSPYDNVEKKAYPWLLVTTSFNDSQVMYFEPAKWVAKLRAMKTDANPLYFKTNLAGDRRHGLAARRALTSRGGRCRSVDRLTF
jgi:hypothetical protein